MYKLGLDIGTNSIGWAVVEIEKKNNKIIPINLIDFGVRIFNNGLTQDTKAISLATERTNAKGARRNQDRYLERREELFETLIKYHLMPMEKDKQKQVEFLNPYQCRSECVVNDLHKSELLNGIELKKQKRQIKIENPLYILGRALFCINQHRGFKSLAEDSSKLEEAHKKLQGEIEASGAITLGDFLWKQILKGEKVRFRGCLEDNGKLKKDKPFPNRAMYEKEIRDIFKFQRKYFPELSEDMENEIVDIIINQRNLRKQQPKVCVFDGNEVTLLAQPLFQKFRIVSEVNNLEIICPDNVKLSLDSKKKLIDGLFNCDKKLKLQDNIASYSSIREYLGLGDDVLFNYECKKKRGAKKVDEDGNVEREIVYKPLVREGLKCSETNSVIYKYISDFDRFSDDEKYAIIEILTDYSKFADDRVNILKDKYKIELDNVSVNKLLKGLVTGYCNLSREILSAILPIMENENKRYDEALETLGLSHSLKGFQKTDKVLKRLPPYSEIDDLKGYLGRDGRITNTTVHIALNQLQIVVNEILQKYEKPECVAVEVARDVGIGEKTKSKIEYRQRENKKVNDEARRYLVSHGLSVTSYNMEKYKVWRNLCPWQNCEEKRFDIYDMSEEQKPIPVGKLFSAEYEIEHILPFSKTGDDSFANKIITNRLFNGDKGDRFPSEWKTNPEDLKKLRSRASLLDFYRGSNKSKADDGKAEKKTSKNKKKEYKLSETWWRFLPNAKEIYEKLTGGMSARDINDTRYITKLANLYVRNISNDWTLDTSNTGVATDLYRRSWQILKVLPRDFDLWAPQEWQQKYLSDVLNDVITFLDKTMVDKEKQKALNEKINGIVKGVLNGNPLLYNKLVDEFEQFVLHQENKTDDDELLDVGEKDRAEKIIKRNAFDRRYFRFEKINVDGLSVEDAKQACYQIFYDLSDKQKDRAQHYHHAVDAIVCACLDTALANYVNTPDFRNGVERELHKRIEQSPSLDEKQRYALRKSLENQFIAQKLRDAGRNLPYKNYNPAELKKRFLDMVVSYQESRNKVKFLKSEVQKGKNKSNCSFIKITDGTALSISENILDSKDMCKFVHRDKEGVLKKEVKSISSMIPIFKTKEQKAEYLDLFDKYFVAKQRFADKKISEDKFNKIKSAFESSFTKDKAYKWYCSSGNYESQIYMVDSKWQVDVVNRYRVFEHLEDKNGYALWHKIYPNAKKVMTLRINDIVKANIKKSDNCKSFSGLKKFIANRFEKNPDKDNMNFYFKVKKMTGDVVYLRPLHIAQEDNGDKKSWIGSVSTLQKYNIKKVYFDVLGREIIHSNLNKKE